MAYTQDLDTDKALRWGMLNLRGPSNYTKGPRRREVA